AMLWNKADLGMSLRYDASAKGAGSLGSSRESLQSPGVLMTLDEALVCSLTTYLIWPLFGSITNLVVAPLFTIATSYAIRPFVSSSPALMALPEPFSSARAVAVERSIEAFNKPANSS